MEWLKITARTTPDGIEPLADALLACGISGVEINDPREYGVFLTQDATTWDYVDDALAQMPDNDRADVVFYLNADAEGEAVLADINKNLAAHPFFDGAPPVFCVERVNDEAWLHEWKKHFAPINVGRVRIVPAWEASPLLSAPSGECSSRITFVLDPGSAFGTGQHATTFLCVEALQEILRPGDTLLDVGCGSGILAIIGLLLGAEKAVACDIDPSAVSATRKNAALNNIPLGSPEVLHGNLLTDRRLRDAVLVRKYDVIVANIVADVVIALLPLVTDLLKPGGHFIASGIIAERAADVRTAFAPVGGRGAKPAGALRFLSDKARDGWHCMVRTRA